MTAEILYEGDLRTSARHIRSGQVIVTDAPPDNQGKGEAFSPSDLTCTSLGACMMTIMGIAARTHEIDIRGTRAEVTKTMFENPRRIGRIEISFFMPDQPYTRKQKSILEHAIHGCPVGRSIHPDIEEVIQFHWPA